MLGERVAVHPFSRGQVRGSGGRPVAPDAHHCLARVPLHRIAIDRAVTLGSGRCGDVLRAVFQGQQFALKQFDLDTPNARSRFEHEVATYGSLAHLQGKYVPRAAFWSTSVSGAVLFLGLQLGVPMPDDFSMWSAEQLKGRDETIAALKSAGYVQTDIEARNFVLLKGDDGVTRVAAVDAESFARVKRRRRRRRPS